MANKIQRINYHTGLFLEEEEFQVEQKYHMHMRRRLNYALFNPGVLYGLTLTYNGSILSIEPGMAIDEFNDTQINETIGREIVVTTKYTVTADLGALNSEVYITISYNDLGTNIKPPTDTPSRITELFDIHKSDTPPTEAEKKVMILLGSIMVGQFGIKKPQQKASLRLGGVALSLESIAITPAAPGVQVGDAVQLTATGTRSDGSTIDLTGAVTWSSNDTAVATVTPSGLVTAVSAGTATITAEHEGKSATVDVTVTAGAANLVDVIIEPPGPIEIKVGYAFSLSAKGAYDDGTEQDLTDTVVWGTSDPSVALVASGNVTGLIEGTAQITATLGSIADGIYVNIVLPVPVPAINPTTPFNQTSGRPGSHITIYGSNFGADLPNLPVVALIDPTSTSIEPNVVSALDSEITFEVPMIEGQATSIDMIVQVTTSGGTVDSSSIALFRWRPPL